MGDEINNILGHSPSIRSTLAVSPTRRRFLRTLTAAGALAAMRGPAYAAIDYAKPADWQKLVRDANADGALTIYGPPGDELYAALVTRFTKEYPQIKVDGVFAIGPDLQSRVVSERSAGLHIPDIWINGSTVALRGLKPIDAIVPLEPLIVSPEILDKSAWFQDEIWWTDDKQPYTNFMFEGLMYPPAFVNTTMVNVSTFKSYWDLTDPKWKGKVVSNDIRAPGPGGVPSRFIYSREGLGRPWFEAFFGKLDIVLSRDNRQIVDWLAQGRYAIAAFINTDEAHLAIDQGLPIAPIKIEQLKEGGAIAPGGGTVSVMKPVPHPNAAKLYLNWLLSRAGQRAWQEETKTPSLRADLPKEGLFLGLPAHNTGVTFINGGQEAYSRLTGQIFDTMITEILRKAGR